MWCECDVLELHIDVKDEEPIVEFLSNIHEEEEAIIQQFLKNLKEVEDVKEACMLSLQKKKMLSTFF